MLVGWGGNNGATLTAGILANKQCALSSSLSLTSRCCRLRTTLERLFPLCSGITWMTKDGLKKPNYWGSLTQASTCRVGNYKGEEVYVPFNQMLPMVNPNDLVLGGWDISSLNLAEAMERAKVRSEY